MADTLTRRALAKFTVGEGCWEWTAGSGSNGYGLIRDGARRRMAHRVVYEILVGPIPEGLTLDHLCRNRSCVNPAHLEPVTLQENIRRADNDTRPWQAAGVVAAAAAKRARTACLNGHPFTPENTRYRGSTRLCRRCAADATATYRRRRGESDR